MSISLKYQGREESKNKNSYSYKETWQGTESEVDSFISDLPAIGSRAEKGYMTSYRKTQSDGAFWQVEVQYTIQRSGFDNSDEETVVGKKSAQLSARCMQMPLQKHKNYLVNWNYYLFGKEGKSVPGFWSSAKTIEECDLKDYRWTKSASEVPEVEKDGAAWKILREPTKPGTQYYEMAVFVVTISAKYRSASSAGNAIKKNINKIVQPDEDFNLGGEWKYDDASVSYDGKHWIATSTYSRAVDKWDQDIYEH